MTKSQPVSAHKLTLYVVKIGGNIIDDEEKLDQFLQDFAAIKGPRILVHGGGKLATRMAEKLGLPQQMVEGRRITDAETLKLVTMVYAGHINKTIVAQLQAKNCNAFGFTGTDGNSIKAHKRVSADRDYGFAGDVDVVNGWLLHQLLQTGLIPVIAPITHDGKGQLLNTNADTIAQETARSLSRHYSVQLIYSFEKSGVLTDAEDETSVIGKIDPERYESLKAKQQVFAGMIPKLDNAFAALNSGVEKVIIGKAEEIQLLVEGKKGTAIVR
jgi:acetylglutamate kinase